MGNGDFRPPLWGSETPEPIELKFGTIDYVGHPTHKQKLVYAGLRVYGGRRGENVTSIAFLYFLLHLY